ncbi:mitochondrial division protein 1 [Octopus sinensis]|uniref:Mitochondrial division protein 1 n=1 Tax=Octopus sinensis TaxID=2607531 RepID=A0A6P7SZI2_9MOLL|nr:mitochondrial division protein 1 [Octopus sinensis]
MSVSDGCKTALEIEIRKLRKKLRQIENLERLDRALLEEEIIKIKKRDSIRKRLRELLIEEAEIWARHEASQATSEVESELVSGQGMTQRNFVSELETTDEELTPETEILSPSCEENGHFEVELISQNNSELSQNDTEISQKDTAEVLQQKENDALETQNQQVADRADDDTTISVQETTPKQSKLIKPKVPKRVWNRSQFLVYNLEGHNDLVTDMDSDGNVLVTASRDTTIRSWDLKTFQEIHIFSGHTGSVTSLQLLNKDDSNRIDELHGDGKGDSLYLLSGSLDCNLKLWHVKSGHVVKSIYTYNPITKLVYVCEEEIIITASDGGKLELWSVTTTDNLYSLRIYEESVTGLQVCNNYIYSCSSEGIIKVHQWQKKKLRCMYESSDLRLANFTPVCQRNIRSFFVVNDKIFYGDDGINIKVVDWKKAIVSKLLNHTEKFGVTDAIFCHQDTLYSSAYDLDKGLAYINVHSLPGEDYLGTLNDEATNQIKCITWCRGSISTGNLLLSTGGYELKVWKQLASSKIPSDLSVVSVWYLPKLTMSGQFSDNESDFSDECDECEDEISENSSEQLQQEEQTSDPSPGVSSWFAMCHIL